MKGEKLIYDGDYPAFRIVYDAEKYRVQFEVFEANSWTGAGEMGIDPPLTICDEEHVLTGYVKWDGCSDWDYRTGQCMRHYCGVAGLKSFSDMQVGLYTLAAELMAELGDTYAAENRDLFFVEDEK